MKNEFFHEFNCIEDGEWISEKVTLEDRLVQDLRFIWNHRYNLERRYSQQHLRNNNARWRFMRQQRETRRQLIREIRAYRSNREFAPDLHQSLESWYLQMSRRREKMFSVNSLLVIIQIGYISKSLWLVVRKASRSDLSCSTKSSSTRRFHARIAPG